MDKSKFNRTLIELSQHITSDLLENMKYMCQDVVLPAKMERVKTALNLFQALEECGKISINDTQYLMDLLEAEGKSKLVEKLRPFNNGVAIDMSQGSLMSYTDVTQARNEFPNVSEAQLNVYRQVLRQISNSLRANELQELCYCCEEAEAAGVQHKANLTGIALFNFLEQRRLIFPDNLEYLRERLYTIRRMDLQNLVDLYTRSYLGGQPSPLIRQDPVHQQQHMHGYQPPAYNPSFHPGITYSRITMLVIFCFGLKCWVGYNILKTNAHKKPMYTFGEYCSQNQFQSHKVIECKTISDYQLTNKFNNCL